MKKKIIDGDEVIVSSPVSGSRYIRISLPNEKESEIGKAVNDIEIEVVKIIGNLVGTEEKIEMIMDKDVFFEWAENIHDMDNIAFDKWARKNPKGRKRE